MGITPPKKKLTHFFGRRGGGRACGRAYYKCCGLSSGLNTKVDSSHRQNTLVLQRPLTKQTRVSGFKLLTTILHIGGSRARMRVCVYAWVGETVGGGGVGLNDPLRCAIWWAPHTLPYGICAIHLLPYSHISPIAWDELGVKMEDQTIYKL